RELNSRYLDGAGDPRHHRDFVTIVSANQVTRLDVQLGVEVGGAEISDRSAVDGELPVDQAAQVERVLPARSVKRSGDVVCLAGLAHLYRALELDLGLGGAQPDVTAHDDGQVLDPKRVEEAVLECGAKAQSAEFVDVDEVAVERVLEVENVLVHDIREVYVARRDRDRIAAQHGPGEGTGEGHGPGRTRDEESRHVDREEPPRGQFEVERGALQVLEPHRSLDREFTFITCQRESLDDQRVTLEPGCAADRAVSHPKIGDGGATIEHSRRSR